MSTHESPSSKRPSAAELESLLATAIVPSGLTCAQLCQERSNDIDLLQDLNEFPVKSRARVRASLLRDLAAIAVALKQKHCPTCPQ